VALFIFFDQLLNFGRAVSPIELRSCIHPIIATSCRGYERFPVLALSKQAQVVAVSHTLLREPYTMGIPRMTTTEKARSSVLNTMNHDIRRCKRKSTSISWMVLFN
jgi:hypothetical protein